MKANLLPLPALALLLLTQCHKSDPDPVSVLPPETQTGANTFGCLINGQAWTPRGNDGTANYTVSYDRLLNGGLLEISAYRINGSGATDFQSIALWASQLTGPRTYSFLSKKIAIISFNDQKSNCYWRSRDSTTTYCRGQLTISRLDRSAGIVSGTFAFTLYRSGCDSVRITQGRFDRKL